MHYDCVLVADDFFTFWLPLIFTAGGFIMIGIFGFICWHVHKRGHWLDKETGFRSE